MLRVLGFKMFVVIVLLIVIGIVFIGGVVFERVIVKF